MVRPFGPRVIAVAGVLCTAVASILTNILTDRWSWTVACALAVVVVFAAVLAWRDRTTSGGRGRTTVVQTADRGSVIADMTIEASNGASVVQSADRKGRIERGRITADNEVDPTTGALEPRHQNPNADG